MMDVTGDVNKVLQGWRHSANVSAYHPWGYIVLHVTKGVLWC